MTTIAAALRALVLLSAAVGLPAVADRDRDDLALNELTARWWQWAMSIPASVNPVTDGTGAWCMVGQRGPVWFLAGSTTGAPTVRTCTVPAEMPLFFPVINLSNVNTPGCFQEPRDLSIAELRAAAAPLIDGATGLSVLLDNRPVRPLRRVRSIPFVAVFPAGNLFGADCVVPGKPYWPAIDDGYYVMLEGLRPGQHHLGIRGTNAGGFLVDVFYTLNVVAFRTDPD